MSREWSAVYSAMLTRPKFRRLSPIGRGALLQVFLLAGFQTPEATWDDPDGLREALELDGFPRGALDELIALGWLDQEDGALVIHDWDDHQQAATVEVRRTWEAARKREWRRKKKPPPSPAPLTPTEQDITPQPQDNGRDMSRAVPDMSRTNGQGDGGREGLEEVRGVYFSLYHREPTQGAMSYFASLLDRAATPRVLKALRGEHAKDPNPRTLISRMQKGLELGSELARKSDWSPDHPKQSADDEKGVAAA